jgi:hypothetical protein
MKVEIEDIKKDKEDMYLSAVRCLPEHGAHASVKKSKRLHFFRFGGTPASGVGKNRGE